MALTSAVVVLASRGQRGRVAAHNRGMVTCGDGGGGYGALAVPSVSSRSTAQTSVCSGQMMM
jgi:hypothetical protein